MGGQLESYRKEIFDFLRTVTIKFDPFAEVMGEMEMKLHGIPNPHGAFNRYYINLTGQYSPEDELMYVYSHEEERMVLFDKNIHTKYPKSAATYKVTKKEYALLEEKYPNNRGLIQAISYPIPMTMDELIAAPNLSLVGYDASLLHPNEQESLITRLKEYLHMVSTRWWIPEYSYEDMYPITFWAMLWQSLPMVLMSQRYDNIRTPYAHPYHIWEYLLSKGLGDYRDVLSNTQSLWLYRNMNYILANKGKYNNLRLLAENILQEVYVSLLYKDMRQNNTGMAPRPIDTDEGIQGGTTTRSMAKSTQSLNTDSRSISTGGQYFTIPEFVSYNVLDDSPVGTIESFSYINSRMLNSDMEFRDDLEFVSETEAALGIHNFNELPTKVMELKKEPIDTSNDQLIVHFLFDNLMYAHSQGNLAYNVTVTDPYTAKPLKMSVENAILLLYWANLRSAGEMPTMIPKGYTPILALKTPLPLDSDIPDTFNISENEYRTRAYIDVVKLRSLMGGDVLPVTYTSVEDYMCDIAIKCMNFISIKDAYKNSCSYGYHQAMHVYLLHTLKTSMLHLKLTNEATFQEWYPTVNGLETIIATYEDTADNIGMYKNLATSTFDAVFPLVVDGEMLLDNSTRAVETLYTAMRDLFIQLCSYHINFLEGTREVYEYVPISELDLHLDNLFPSSWDMFFNIVLHPLGFTSVSVEPIAPIDAHVGSYGVMDSLTFLDSSMSGLTVGVSLAFEPVSFALHYIPMGVSPIETSRNQSVNLDFSIQWGDHVDHPF